MPLYQHRFQGHCSAGDIFVFSWWSETSVSIDTSQSNAVSWASAVWAGASGVDGMATFTTPNVGLDRITTGDGTPTPTGTPDGPDRADRPEDDDVLQFAY